MNNPFETIDKRLSNIENLLVEINSKPKEDLSNKRYSIKEAAKLLNVIPLTIINHIKKGNIKAERLAIFAIISVSFSSNDATCFS